MRIFCLVNQLLDFRKIQNKKMKVLVEKTELVSQLQKIMESFHLIAKEKRIDFQLQTNTDEAYVLCFYVPNLDVPELSERLLHALEFLIQGWILKLKECVIHVKYQ